MSNTFLFIVNVTQFFSLGLILVRTKFHTIALEEYLNVHPLLSSRAIKTGHMTGQGSVEEMGLPGGQQATVLKQFREGFFSSLRIHRFHLLCFLFRNHSDSHCNGSVDENHFEIFDFMKKKRKC